MKKIIYSVIIILLISINNSCTKESILTTKPVAQNSANAKTAKAHYIGELFGGGIIFYLDNSEKHGLIAASQDIEEPLAWSKKDTLNGAKDTALGAGSVNTLKIYRTQGFPKYEVDTYAALECMEFTLNGYEDWYLPSLNELNKLYLARTKVGGFRTFAYWSSSESDISKAWLVNFSSGAQSLQFKTAQYALRPVRKF